MSSRWTKPSIPSLNIYICIIFASAVFIWEYYLHADFLMPLFLLCEVIQQPKGLIVKHSLTSAQVRLPAQKQTQPKQMVLQTKTCPTGRNYAFTEFF